MNMNYFKIFCFFNSNSKKMHAEKSFVQFLIIEFHYVKLIKFCTFDYCGIYS